MGVKEDIETSLASKHITKIQDQPTDRSLTNPKKELTKIAASVPSALGGRKNYHTGTVLVKDTYITFSKGGAKFNIPVHPGAYPATVSNTPEVRAGEEAAHKAKIVEYETCAGVVQAIKDHIVTSVDEEWIAEINHEVMGFTNKTPIKLLEHLESRGGMLNFIDTQEIKQERDILWDSNEHIVTYFNQVEQVVKLLDRANIALDETKLMNQAL